MKWAAATSGRCVAMKSAHSLVSSGCSSVGIVRLRLDPTLAIEVNKASDACPSRASEDDFRLDVNPLERYLNRSQ